AIVRKRCDRFMTTPHDLLTLAVLVNPFAGLGGAVGLKGSDGEATRDEALRRGATPMAVARMTRALQAVTGIADRLRVLTWGGDMGERSCREAGRAAEVIGTAPAPSGPRHSREAAAALRDAGADLLLFAGGDGTARDLVDAVGLSLPVLG